MGKDRATDGNINAEELGTVEHASKEMIQEQAISTGPKLAACYLTDEEIELLESLQDCAKSETGKRWSKARVLEQSLLHFSEYPTEVDLPPRAEYRRDVRSLTRIPFTLENELFDQLKVWVDEHSASQNQIVRHALKQYAQSKKITTKRQTEETWPEIWKNLKISAVEAADLAKTDRATINLNGNLGKYTFFEIEGRGPRPKKLYNMIDIIKHYRVTRRDVEDYLSKNEQINNKTTSEI